jgi:hypothetical protein
MPDKDGYPTKAELKFLEQNGRLCVNSQEAVEKYIDFIEGIWKYSESMFHFREYHGDIIIEMHSGGWSGNEEIIGALQRTFFWFLFWEKSTRGGHHYFKICTRIWRGKNDKKLKGIFGSDVSLHDK